MTEASCRREMDLEVPAVDVQKAVERVAREFARVARVPGFRPGKAPVTLIRRRFADDIKSEVVQKLVPERIEQALTESKLVPVTQPQIDKVDFSETGPLKFSASFEVLPEFTLGEYKNLEVEVDAPKLSDADVEKTLEELRERAATYVPVEDRAVENGDYAQLKLLGTPAGGGDPLQADNVLCHIGAEETIEAFNEALRGSKIGDHKKFDVQYPPDYPDAKLAGKSYHYAIEVLGIKSKKLPELNDEFAKDISKSETLAELREQIRKDLEAAREHREKEQARDKILAKLIAAHDFPVPEALAEQQVDTRLEAAVRRLISQGVDPRAVNVDWVAMRQRQRQRAVDDVKAELLLDRIATAERIEVNDDEVQNEIAKVAEHSGESAAAIHARLTKQGTLDRIKSKLRSDKTLEWLYQNSRVRAASEAKGV
jgi:trigger factor